MTLVVPGSASRALGRQLAGRTGAMLANVETRRFPDGEAYVRLGTPVEGEHAVVVQSTHPNDQLVEALLLQDACREGGAASITTVVPYFAYARQDRVFRTGEPVSSRAVARALGADADQVVLVDPHKESILEFFPCPATSVTAVPQLAEVLSRWEVDAVLAPDLGAKDRAADAASRMGVACDHLEKTRLGPTEVRIEAKELDVRDRRVAIVDDMIASGGTMVKAAQQLKAQGASTVFAACTHGLFTGGAVARLLAGGIDRVLCTDTLEAEGCDTISAAAAVAQALDLRTPAA